MGTISDILERPPDRHLHLFVGLPAAVRSPTLGPMAGECSIRLFALAQDICRFRCLKVTSLLIRFSSEYEDIFVKVKQWRAFEEFDVVGDEIYMCSEVRAPVPDVGGP